MAFICPYCNNPADEQFAERHIYSYNQVEVEKAIYSPSRIPSSDSIVIELYRCSECKKMSIKVYSLHEHEESSFKFSYPPDGMKIIPDHVPKAIREDYFEALSIVDLSPKSSAALCRRCLQGIIRDVWNIKGKKLNEEISALKGKIPDSQWNAINQVRKIGNIGAHMEKDINLIIDIEPEEARKLIDLIELLIDEWYISEHKNAQLYKDIDEIAKKKHPTNK